MTHPHFLDQQPRQIAEWLAARGAPAFRAKQIRQWLFGKRVASFEEMSNLPAPLQSELAESFTLFRGGVAHHSQAADGTEKLLVDLQPGQQIECVLLRDGGRRSICISSQVGCAMGCVFCASGLDGVERNLTAGEIVEQMLRLARLLPPEERLSHIVVMGMGEPLANVDNLLLALAEASAEDGLGISPRRITISTVGLPAAIDKLSDRGCKYNLAVSLHAPNDELRNRLVPVNRNIGLADILTAADRYFETSGRRLTFEYVLLAKENDRPEHAEELAQLLRGRPAMLNVIPYNSVAGLPYGMPTARAQQQFLQVLERRGVNVQVRQRKGDKIDAACGQLRRIKHRDDGVVELSAP